MGIFARWWILGLALLLSAGSLSGQGVRVLLDEGLHWKSNIFSDYTAMADLVNFVSLGFSDMKVTDSSVGSWQIVFGAENYFSNPSESNYLGKGYFKYRFKFSRSILDLDADLLYDKYPRFTTGRVVDNPAYSHLTALGRVVWRLDLSHTSLYLGYHLGGAVFPDYTLDNLAHTALLQLSHDFSLYTTVNAGVSFLYRSYSERYVLDTSATASGAAFYDAELEARLSLRHVFSVDTELTLAGVYRRVRSNGNFYFYGPNETTYDPLNPDRMLLDDFYSHDSIGSTVSLSHRIGTVKVILNAGHLYRLWTARPPFNAADEPQLGVREYDIVVSAGTTVEWRISDAVLFKIQGAYEWKDSNNFKQQTDGITAGCGVQIVF